MLIDDEDRLNSTKLLRTIQGRSRSIALMVPFVAPAVPGRGRQRTGEVPSSLKVFTSGNNCGSRRPSATCSASCRDAAFATQYSPTEGHVVSEFELTGAPTPGELRTSASRSMRGTVGAG